MSTNTKIDPKSNEVKCATATIVSHLQANFCFRCLMSFLHEFLAIAYHLEGKLAQIVSILVTSLNIVVIATGMAQRAGCGAQMLSLADKPCSTKPLLTQQQQNSNGKLFKRKCSYCQLCDFYIRFSDIIAVS